KRTFQTTLNNVTDQIALINKRLAVIAKAEKAAANLDPLQQLVVISQEDNAETRLGKLIAQQETLQQQLAFAKKGDRARVIVAAKAEKASARSRNTSLVIGALIGLLIGCIVAIAGENRFSRP